MWIELRSQGLERRDFAAAVRERRWYVDGSMYFYQLSAFLERTSRDNILVLPYDSLLGEPRDSLRCICRFLGIGESFDFDDPGKRVYESAGKRFDTAIVAALRGSIPGFTLMRDRSPGWLRRAVSLALKVEFRGRPRWPESLRKATWDAVEHDASRVLDFAGYPELLDEWRARALAPLHGEGGGAGRAGLASGPAVGSGG